MLFDHHLFDAIMRGEITVTFRAWSRPMARAGARHRLNPRGVIEIASVERVSVETIKQTDARRAGYTGRATLLADLARRQRTSPELVYRVEFRFVPEPDARIKLGRAKTLTDDEFASTKTKLDRMDARAAGGAWTRATLRIIAANPRVLSTTLAEQLGRERFAFKADVRKLKALGLTISHDVGYEISPRGHAFLEGERDKR